MQKEEINLIWFRNDLRVRDQEGLLEASRDESLKTLALYCFDPRHFAKTKYGFRKTEKFRAQFLIESFQNLKTKLKKLNITLVIFHKKPEDAIDFIKEKFQIKSLFFQNEWTSEELFVEKKLLKKLNNCHVKKYDSQFLFSPSQLPYSHYKNIPEVFTQFRKACEKTIYVRPEHKIPQPKAESNLITIKSQVPNLEDLGFKNFEIDARSAFPFKGGEDAAWERINPYFWKSHKLKNYKKHVMD